MARAQQQADARGVHDALLHGEALLIVAAGDFEDVAFELGTHAVARDLLAHAFVHEAAQFAVVFDLDELLGAIGRVGDVELHPDGWGVDVKMVGGSICLRCRAGNSPSETLCELRDTSYFSMYEGRAEARP